MSDSPPIPFFHGKPGAGADLQLLEWYRPDPRPQMLSIWLMGSGLVIAGMACALLALLGERLAGPVPRVTLGLVGGALVLGGPLSAMVRLVRAMRDESYVALLRIGVLICEKGHEELLVWDAIQEAAPLDTKDEGLRFLRHDAPPLELRMRFPELSAAKLAARINHLRSKVLMGLSLGPRT